MQQRHFVLGRLHGRLRIGLRDVLLSELQVEPRLLEVELLLGRVELDDDVAGFERVAGIGELHDLQLTAHGRGCQLDRPGPAQLADGVDGDLHAAALHARRRNGFRTGSGNAANDRDACRYRCGKRDDEQRGRPLRAPGGQRVALISAAVILRRPRAPARAAPRDRLRPDRTRSPSGRGRAAAR